MKLVAIKRNFKSNFFKLFIISGKKETLYLYFFMINKSHIQKLNIADFLRIYVEYGELAKGFSLILPEMDSFIAKAASGKDVLIPFTSIFQLIHFGLKANDKELVIFQDFFFKKKFKAY